MKLTLMLALLLGLALCGCKEAGDTIENKSSADVKITITASNGEVRKQALRMGILFAMPRWKDDTSPWRFYRIEASDPSGRIIGVLEVNSDLRRDRRTKYLQIVVLQNRLEVQR